MRKTYVLFFIVFTLVVLAVFSSFTASEKNYFPYYKNHLEEFKKASNDILSTITQQDPNSEFGKAMIKQYIQRARLKLKTIDFFLRYLEPIAYKKTNGSLPVEWETEVFEKWEKPYKREGGGLTLAELYLTNQHLNKDTLVALIHSSIDAIEVFKADSIANNLMNYHHFFLANRLYLLNLAAIYTTGFECPDKANIIIELLFMLADVNAIYTNFNKDFPATPINEEYLNLYKQTIDFVFRQPKDYEQFDHYTFIKNYVNPLFAYNQKMITDYKVVSKNFNDFTLNNKARSIFDKSLYRAQNTKGIYIVAYDEKIIAEIKHIGKLLFHDPILSGNLKRSCASCHKPNQYFTDTTITTALQFDRIKTLSRNTPSLLNAVHNHLLMLDGKHNILTKQGRDVIQNPIELAGKEDEIMANILSCKEYKKAFKKFRKYTPSYKIINLSHVVSAIGMYYSGFSTHYSPFDKAMNENKTISSEAIKGFNLFMSKAQCATCHFVPQFNGVKPPYISSEFEVVGTPTNKDYTQLSADLGRHDVHAAAETKNAFRTNTLRNVVYTKPYMHNGVFNNLEEVMEFYNNGGGQGHKLPINNQTLSADSLHLSTQEIHQLITFIHCLNEELPVYLAPEKLPVSSFKNINARKVGGEY